MYDAVEKSIVMSLGRKSLFEVNVGVMIKKSKALNDKMYRLIHSVAFSCRVNGAGLCFVDMFCDCY